MKYFKNTILASVLGIITIFYSLGHADEHSRSEVRDIIAKVQKKINELKSNKADQYASYEIIRVGDHIKSTEKLLKEGEEDQAYYEIRIGVEYFKLIKARKKLFDEKNAYNKTKRSLTE